MREREGMEGAPLDGTSILLGFAESSLGPCWIEGWWFSSPKEIDDGWETVAGFIGDPSWWVILPSK